MNLFNNSSARNIYIHIPFCKRKCNYCAFVSNTNIDEYESEYIKSLLKEINMVNFLAEINTIYLGGGTPNLLSTKSLEILFNCFHEKFSISDNAEITMEFNPKLSDLSYLKEVKNLGVNRISLGAQSFNNKILQTLNRIHDSKDIFNMIDNIKKTGIDNFSIDIMYGIFGQSLENLKNDLAILKLINPNHISTYGLKIEDNTPFAKFDKTNLPDEDLCADMYLLICDELKSANYNHYEISNFAKNGFESKHNLIYWRNREYYGFGVAAHGFINNIRYKNTNNINSYLLNPMKKEILCKNTEKDNLEEKIFLGLRLQEGIDLEDIKNTFNINLLQKKEAVIKKLIDNKYAILKQNKLLLTEKGFLISNYILGEICSDLDIV